MRRLNYNHLFYFWMVVREGSISAAALKLKVTQPAVSAQVARLEREIGSKLLEKSGRGLVLTPAGATVYAYADEMFVLAAEMLAKLERGGQDVLPVAVGVAQGVPSALAHRLLAPAMALGRHVRLKVRHGSLARVTSELAGREVDLVLCTERLPAGSAVRAKPHALGECGQVLLAAPEMARELAPRFPGSLDGQPLILPHPGVPPRRILDGWMQAQGVTPTVVAEMDDWAESMLLAQAGVGMVAVPAAVEEEMRTRYGLAVVGHAAGAVQPFYALTAERRPRHPAVLAVLEAARENPIRG
jgi:LysR family transcriptional activator of nhaA